MKFWKRYTIVTGQILTFRTLIIGFFLTVFTIKSVRTLLLAINEWTELFLPIGVVIISIGLYLYWLYRDFLVKNKTYSQDSDKENIYKNFSLPELVLDINNNKEPSFIATFYRKTLINTMALYEERTGNNFEIKKKKSAVDWSIRDYFDESYLLKKTKNINNIQDAENLVERNSLILMYGFYSLCKKFDKDWSIDYDVRMEELDLTKKEVKSIKSSVKNVWKMVKMDKNLLELFEVYFETEEMHVLFFNMIINFLAIEYFAKDKFDIFRLLGFIMSPISIIWAMFWN